MERRQLEEYRSNKEEIKELRYKIEHLGEGEALVGNDTIFDYRSGYPRPQAVVGMDWNRHDRLYKKYKMRLTKLQKECEEVEAWIEDIPDGLTRRIFRMYFVDGMRMQKIGIKVHMDKSSISRKIDNYFKVATNTTNAML